MKRLAAVALAVPLLMAQTASQQQKTVKAVRHWALPEATRIAVEVSGEFTYRSDRLHNPERIYFDIVGARPYIAERRLYNETLDNPIVQRIRVAETSPGITRVVLDLGDSVDVSASQLMNPARLIVELRRLPVEVAEAKKREQPQPPAPAIQSPAATTAEQPPVAAANASQAEKVTVDPTKAQRVKPDVPAKQNRAAGGAKAEAVVQPGSRKAPGPPSPEPKPATRTSAGGSSLIRTLGLKIGKVVIDAGHGGHDQGTEGSHGLLEKDVVLDVAKRVGRMVEERLGAEVIYTRTDDTFIPLERRTAIANESKADLFLSIHANSSPAPNVAGIETFYLNFTGTQDAMDVAARENAGAQLSVYELSSLVQKIAKHDKSEESREFAQRVQAALYAFSAKNVPNSKNRGIKSAPFVVLIGANMPSVLTEIGFLSNSREETLLKKSDYREKLADAIFRGVLKYTDGLSHFQTAEKPAPRVPAAQTASAEDQ
jgi:N-acetylmuramoyl-L-alanine amidase